MPKEKPFDENSTDYDYWFTENQNIYTSELNAIKSFVQSGLYGVEVGVGTGRFALPLDIQTGVEPSDNMAKIARERGIKTLRGTAESLPLPDNAFDFVLMVTAICFFDDVKKAFLEAYRVLKKNGFIIVAFIDGESDLGKQYKKHKKNNTFYKDATFYSVSNITDLLNQAGFSKFEYRQTVYNTENILHEVKDGYGSGGFVVIKASASASLKT
jgi:ubiquinone/menaquinone biosynthesis C-methylase UbiE